MVGRADRVSWVGTVSGSERPRSSPSRPLDNWLDEQIESLGLAPFLEPLVFLANNKKASSSSVGHLLGLMNISHAAVMLDTHAQGERPCADMMLKAFRIFFVAFASSD